MGSTRQRSTREEPAKHLPHDRVPLPAHLQLLPAIGRFPGRFPVQELTEATGLSSWVVGLAMKFYCACGLARKVSSRGLYEPSETAREISAAWDKAPEEGAHALRDAWRKQWFAGAARQRSLEHPATRAALRQRFLALAKVPGYEKNVDRLLDLMVELGFLVEEPEGFFQWYEGANSASANGEAPTTGSDGHEGRAPQEEGQEHAASEDDEEQSVPGPRQSEENTTGAGFGQDAGQLLSRRLGMGEAWHLDADEATALHHHVTGLLTVLSALHTRAAADGTPLKPELTAPLWSLAEIAAMDRAEWLDTHRLIQQLGATTPLRKESTTN
ncbi:hypothetical protein [Streptomyces corynorhini]|uniref:Uncharacterized protein n=1 Tax=Streptomyces corynorhini TaxID=2282652 RepID=A0A370BCP8_9ACTN|nr:hypothetical protein [Streptomyces corynorhini]RDG37984.1 hypothetical protein DVH02_11735 [Streptomyces corynorhini]